VSADAQSSSAKQLADVEGLLARGARVLVIVAQDADAIAPALALARAEGVPVVAYDRLIEARDVVYLSFDNREVGRLQARSILEVRPSGRYVYIKGSPQDPNAHFVYRGQRDVLDPEVERGAVEIVGDAFVDGWLPELAQKITEQILTARANGVDAIVCSNDGMAGGVAAALAAQGLRGIPLSGQDGDHAALNRIARGLQTVSVWKDTRALGRRAGEVALQLAAGRAPLAIEGVQVWKDGPGGVAVPAQLLAPVAVTRDRLDVVLDAGWIERAALCRGADPAIAAVCRTGR